jgi:hypothetical protein
MPKGRSVPLALGIQTRLILEALPPSNTSFFAILNLCKGLSSDIPSTPPFSLDYLA